MLLLFDVKSTFSVSELLSSYSMDLILLYQCHCVTSHYNGNKSLGDNIKF